MNEPDPLIIDHHGNNYVVACIDCGKPYLLSGFIHRKGRDCPHCGKTRAILNRADKTVMMHPVRRDEP